MEEMKKILALSYNDLPYHLKTCLLHLSLFPEDYEIKRDQLVRRWIAEGFITIEGGHDMEEIGECYFNDLINRSITTGELYIDTSTLMPVTQEPVLTCVYSTRRAH